MSYLTNFDMRHEDFSDAFLCFVVFLFCLCVYGTVNQIYFIVPKIYNDTTIRAQLKPYKFASKFDFVVAVMTGRLLFSSNNNAKHVLTLSELHAMEFSQSIHNRSHANDNSKPCACIQKGVYLPLSFSNAHNNNLKSNKVHLFHFFFNQNNLHFCHMKLYWIIMNICIYFFICTAI